MIGELLTTRLKLTLDLRLELLGAHLDGIHPGTAEGEDETPSIHPRDLRPIALRDQATAVPVDRRRQPQIAYKLGRGRRRNNLVRQLDRDGRHREIPLFRSRYSNRNVFPRATRLCDPAPTRRLMAAQTRSNRPMFVSSAHALK